MKKLLFVFVLVAIVCSMIQIPAFANSNQPVYFDGETLTIENFVFYCYCDSVTVYEKNGLLQQKSWYYEGDDAFSLYDGGYKDFASYLKQQGWADVTKKNPYESEGFNRLNQEETFTKGDFKISISTTLSPINEEPEYTNVSFINTAVASIPGETTAETIKQFKPIGNGLSHTIKDGVLTISGNGEMFDVLDEEDLPWYNEKITKIIIGENVTRIGWGGPFDDLSELTTVEIKNPDISVESSTFRNCPKLKEIFFAGTQEQVDAGNLAVALSDDIVIHLGDGSRWLSENAKEMLEEELREKANQIKMTIGSKNAIVFGEAFTMDVAPQIINGRTMLPARYVTEHLGGDIEWIEEKEFVAIQKEERILIFQIGSPKVCELTFFDDDEYSSHLDFSDDFPRINFGESEFDEILDRSDDYMQYSKTFNEDVTDDYAIDGYLLDSAPVIIEGRTFMPVRFIATFLGADVMWDDKTQTVTLEKLPEEMFD